jgi:hypothetical protein
MYNVIRRIHLYCGLIIVIFVMMYSVSGFIMTHRPWFNVPHPGPTTRSAALESADDQPDQQLSADVQRQLSLAGRIQFPQKQPSANVTRFWINRPGTMIRVDVSRPQRLILLNTQRVGWDGKLIMLHKVNGYDAEPIFDAYALFCDLTGVAMILFALSGVYLWWRRTTKHLWGILCLIASCGYGVGMMVYLAYAP